MAHSPAPSEIRPRTAIDVFRTRVGTVVMGSPHYHRLVVDYLTPDFRSVVLVTIDIQVDTLDGQPLEVPGTSAVVPRIAALAAAFRDAGRPIVHMVRLYREDGSNADLCR